MTTSSKSIRLTFRITTKYKKKLPITGGIVIIDGFPM